MRLARRALASLAQIASLVATEFAGGSMVRAWHFYGYNDIAAEPIGTRAKYWQDPEHFNFEMGGSMLEDMFGGDNDSRKFGRTLVSGNIDSTYREFLAQRDSYMKQHVVLQQDFQKLLLK